MFDARPPAFDCRVVAPGVDLLQLIHASFPDPHSRCAAVAAEVFNRWQLGGQALTPNLPTALLVNLGSLDLDPVWQLVGQARRMDLACGDRTEAVQTMRKLVDVNKNGIQRCSTHLDKVRSEWRNARKAGFGSARCGGYTDMWQPSLGLITGASNEVVLRLDSEADHKRFRRDVHSHPERLTTPLGWDDRLRAVAKSVAVSGSLPGKSWDTKLVTDVMMHELPVVFLPHATLEKSPLQGMLSPLLAESCYISPWEPQAPKIAPITHLPDWPDRPWLKALETMLRSRSQFLPPGYQFFLLRTLRELIPICIKIVAQIPKELVAGDSAGLVISDLLQMTIRTMVAGVECLTWHGWGLPSGSPDWDILKALRNLRAAGPVSRKQWGQRPGPDGDEMLEALTQHGLVDCDSQEVAAVPLKRFLENLSSSGVLPPLELLSAPHYRKLTGRTG